MPQPERRPETRREPHPPGRVHCQWTERYCEAMSPSKRPVHHDTAQREVPADTHTGSTSSASSRPRSAKLSPGERTLGGRHGREGRHLQGDAVQDRERADVVQHVHPRAPRCRPRRAGDVTVPRCDSTRDAVFVEAGSGAVIVGRGTRVGHHYELLGALRGTAQAARTVLVTLTDASEVFPLFQHPGTS